MSVRTSQVTNAIKAVSEIKDGLAAFTSLENQAQLWSQQFYKNLTRGTNGMLDGDISDFKVIVFNNRKGMTLRFDHLTFEPIKGDSDDVTSAYITIDFVEVNATPIRQFLCESMVIGYTNVDTGKTEIAFSKHVMLKKLSEFYDVISQSLSKV
ncbi:hypothetical protein [Ewingella americana]|uniref:Uncharacterized protein n=1 Tax=Ewingella americana TaxID=41202 RepID=A0A502GHA9_9GAMM|nr:hypothetical protein [Ewingella americana]TPG60113.1 hypothetical protein EAH77_16220 [Ewingella americana]